MECAASKGEKKKENRFDPTRSGRHRVSSNVGKMCEGFLRITSNVHPFMHSTTQTSFKNYDTFASESFNVLTGFQLGLFRSKENRLYIIGYPLSAPMMRINVSLESDSLEVKSKKVKISSPA